jgi:homoserine kinase type II
VTVRGKPAALYPYVEGTIRCQRGVTAADASAVGEALARVHLAGARLDPARGLTAASRFGPEAISGRLQAVSRAVIPDQAVAREVAGACGRLAATLDAIVTEPVRAPSLPLVHGDLFRDNVLFHPTGLALLDFESSSTGTASFDLAVTALAWCYGDDLEPDLVRALAAGYRRARPLDAAEHADLDRAARLACVRFATTRLTDYELRPRGLGVYKDFRRWIGRLGAVERAPAAFAGLFAA